jgi:hypothetical protein
MRIEGTNLIVKLHSEAGDEIFVAMLNNVIDLCKENIAQTSQQAIEGGVGNHHIADTVDDIKLIGACVILLEYLGVHRE